MEQSEREQLERRERILFVQGFMATASPQQLERVARAAMDLSGGEAAMHRAIAASDQTILKTERLREYGETERYTLDNFDDAMKYQPWNKLQVEGGDIVREALTAAGKAILRVVPPSRFRDKALDGIVQARMDANAAISFRGRF